MSKNPLAVPLECLCKTRDWGRQDTLFHRYTPRYLVMRLRRLGFKERRKVGWACIKEFVNAAVYFRRGEGASCQIDYGEGMLCESVPH